MILDADLTVSPDVLPRFYDAIYKGQAEFVNGVRLVYPMEKEAMRFFNLVGNKFFSLVFPGCWDSRLKIPCAVRRCSGKPTMKKLQPTVPILAISIHSAILTFYSEPLN